MNQQQTYDVEEARNKNKDEYNSTAGDYDSWQNGNVLMQNICYHATFKELEAEGIQGKTFLEVGCGPCPNGQRLARRGAKKIYGLDISEEMIANAKKDLE